MVGCGVLQPPSSPRVAGLLFRVPITSEDRACIGRGAVLLQERTSVGPVKPRLAASIQLLQGHNASVTEARTNVAGAVLPCCLGGAFGAEVDPRPGRVNPSTYPLGHGPSTLCGI